jgi:hypothetical protein
VAPDVRRDARQAHRYSLAGLHNPGGEPDPVRVMLGEQADQLAAGYDRLASDLDRTDHGNVPVLAPPRFRDPFGSR